MNSYYIDRKEFELSSPRRIQLPGSKSESLRALTGASLASGISKLYNLCKCDDVDYFIKSLRDINIDLREHDNVTHVHGCSGVLEGHRITVNAGLSATGARFLMAIAALRKGETVVDGSPPLRKRPHKPLLAALTQLGLEINLSNDNALPVAIKSLSPIRGGTLSITGKVSSQYISALMLVGWAFENGLNIEIIDDIISEPYIGITINMLAKFGIQVQKLNKGKYRIPPQNAHSSDISIEGDASAASYYSAFAMLHGTEYIFENLGTQSTQGDYEFFKICELLGAKLDCSFDKTRLRGPGKKKFTRCSEPISMKTMPDVAPTLMMLAPFVPGGLRIIEIGSLRVKECDRISIPAANLKNLGISIREGNDWLEIDEIKEGTAYRKLLNVDTHDDHRIAMSFAILGSALGGITIKDPECVGKSFRDFWKDFTKIGLSYKQYATDFEK